MAHISTLDYAMEAPQRHVGQPFPSPTRTPRFLLRGQGAVKASVDGAWFPWTTNVTAELHDLISALSLRLGPIARVAFDWNTISSAAASYRRGRRTGSAGSVPWPAPRFDVSRRHLWSSTCFDDDSAVHGSGPRVRDHAAVG